MLLADRRLRQTEETLLHLATVQALHQARMVPRTQFVATYLRGMPQDLTRQEWVAALEMLTDEEIWQVARSGDPDLPDVVAMSQREQLAYLREQP